MDQHNKIGGINFGATSYILLLPCCA
jgi:hypothetical protein